LCTVIGFFDIAQITESGYVTVEMNVDNSVIKIIKIIIIRRRKKIKAGIRTKQLLEI